MKLILFFLILTLILSACDSGSANDPRNFRVGTNGLTMRFIDSAPPDEIPENQIFTIAAELKNDGASDITDGLVLIRVEDDLVSLAHSGNAMPLSLKGKSISNPYGEEYFLEATAQSHPIALTSLQETTVSLLSCYSYQTKFQDEICVKPEINAVSIVPESCTSETIQGSSQGGPVAVTKVEPKPLLSQSGARRVQLKIDIAHKGTGVLTLPVDTRDLCSSGTIRRESFNRVQITGSLGPRPLRCQRDGEIRLEDEKGSIVCEVDVIGEGASFNSPININLAYTYMDSISKTINIKRIS